MATSTAILSSLLSTTSANPFIPIIPKALTRRQCRGTLSNAPSHDADENDDLLNKLFQLVIYDLLDDIILEDCLEVIYNIYK